MRRSFDNRVFGGVCGGLSATLRLNAWVLRALFVALAVLSGGIIAALYVALWWAMPQESLLEARGRGGFGLTFIAVVAFGMVWAGRELGWLLAPNGESLVLAALLLVLSVTFVLRQLRA